ncbi:MAG: glycerophosphodiester phosphodiesterase [Deltaproteobacteria bacterium]|nr:glycerophosphodiester phosphodiesterase [Deltaproteobacteria bacterium]
MKKIYFYLIFFLTSFDLLAAIEIHGHRGARARRPENTLPAFEYAMKIGADVLELDMNITKDLKIVVSHDSFISPRLCLDEKKNPAKKIPIYSLTLEEVKKFDCGSIKNSKFPDQVPVPGAKIPTLDEVFNLAGPSKIQFNIETKIDPRVPDLSPSPEVFAKLVVDEIEKHHLVSRVVLQSFDYRTLEEAKKLNPKIRISMLIQNSDLPNWLKIAEKLQAEIISPEFVWLNSPIVEEAHAAKLKVIPWTLHSKSEWREAKAWNVDGIITDDPEALKDYLNQ